MNAIIITGERSAENYASLLIDHIKKIASDINFYSVCSDIISNKTTKVGDYTNISVIGIKEAKNVLKEALKLQHTVKKTIKEKNIKLVILIDFPEFNMPIAKLSKKLGAKVVYYITPQVWAWRRYRTKKLNLYTDLIIPILPFERCFLNLNNIDKNKIAYFGHPLVDLLYEKTGKHKKENVILIMPGSRNSEILFHAEVMLKAAEIIKKQTDRFDFVWVYPEHLNTENIKHLTEKYEFVNIKRDPHIWMDKAYFGILKSGTTTLEAALFGLPMVVAYRVSNISYRVGKMLIKNIKFISLPNLILNKPIVKELLQDKFNEHNIADAFFEVYHDKSAYKKMQENLRSISSALGEYPITPKIAKAIVEIL